MLAVMVELGLAIYRVLWPICVVTADA